MLFVDTHFVEKLKIHKFLTCARPQISNLQICMTNLQITNYLQNFTKYCTTLSQNSPKSCPFKFFLFVLWIRAFYAILLRRKIVYLQTFGSFKSDISKKIESANCKSAKRLICWRSTNMRICDLPPLINWEVEILLQQFWEVVQKLCNNTVHTGNWLRSYTVQLYRSYVTLQYHTGKWLRSYTVQELEIQYRYILVRCLEAIHVR